MVEMTVGGRRVITYETAAAELECTTSALRSRVQRAGIQPAGHVTKNVPVFYPEDLGLEQS